MARKERIISTPAHQRQIRNRITLVVVLAVIAAALFSLNFYYREFKNWQTFENSLDVLLLINFNAVLLLLLIFLILRNLIKLVYERKRRKLGFKLKSKLTLGFILVSSLPMVLFFFIANGLLRNSLDVWFKGEYSRAFVNTTVVLDQYGSKRERELQNIGKVIIEDYLKQPFHDQLKEPSIQWFHQSLNRYQLEGMALYGPDFKVVQSWFLDPSFALKWKPVPPEVWGSAPEPLRKLTTQMEHAQVNRVFLHFLIQGEKHTLEITDILQGTFYVDLKKLRKNLKDNQQLRALEEPLRTSLSTYLLFFTVLIIFGGTWFGYYLARSIVEPIQTLVDGTRRIAKGDLDFQINLQEDDEIGLLLESFNVMTKELQQNRRKLADSREALLETNLQLEERNIFVELVVQNIQNGVFLIDNSGYVKAINPYMLNLYQLKSHKVIGKHYKGVLSKDQTVLVEEMIEGLELTGSQEIKREVHLVMEKRTIHLDLEMFQLKNPKDELLGKLLVVNDLTELDRSTRAKAWQEVARRIAHEIKNPLTPIQLSAQRIRKNYLEVLEDSDLLDGCTATIIKEVNHLKNMVNEFSKFARLPEINPCPSQISLIIDEVVALFRPGLPLGVQLHLEMPDDLPTALLDQEQIKRVFTNLLDNALAALKEQEQGEIRISVRFATAWKTLVVEIIDDGCGIPEEMIPRIFDPYVTTKKEGTGLGLAIVQQIISDHGGFIRLENIEKGTKFTVELPV